MVFTPIQQLILSESSAITPSAVVDMVEDKLHVGTPPDELAEFVGHTIVQVVDHIAEQYGLIPSNHQDFMEFLVDSLTEVHQISCYMLSFKLNERKMATIH